MIAFVLSVVGDVWSEPPHAAIILKFCVITVRVAEKRQGGVLSCTCKKRGFVVK